MSSTSPALPAGARCATHPDKDAARACSRCGTFACSGCLVAGELCTGCKKRLLADGTPWTAEEKARAAARRMRSWAERGLRAELVLAAVGALISVGANAGGLPRGLVSLGLWTWGGACLLGLVVTGVAGVGYRRSEQGRPGPAVEGVFGRSEAGLLGALALMPTVLAVAALVGR